MEALIGVAGTVVGAILAGGFVYLNDKRKFEFERDRESRALLLEKYEVIYGELEEYRRFSAEVAFNMLGDLGYGKKLDIKNVSVNLTSNRLVMNIDFFAPELREDVAKLKLVHDQVTKSLAEFIVKDNEEWRTDKTAMAMAGAKELAIMVEKVQSKLATLVNSRIGA